MKHKVAWWADPTKIVSLLLGIGAIGSWVIGSYIAQAKEDANNNSWGKMCRMSKRP